MTPESRAWSEYLNWSRGAVPDQYETTERRAWERLQRSLHPLTVDDLNLEVPDAPPSDDQ